MSAEPALANLASEVDEARVELMRAARTKPGHHWTVRELMGEAKGDLRETVAMIALDQLLNAGELETDSRWHVLARE